MKKLIASFLFFTEIPALFLPQKKSYRLNWKLNLDSSPAPDSFSSSKEELWAQLIKIQKEEMETVVAERAKIEEEKKSMSSFKADPSDIITINAGGQAIIQAHRDTLCLASGSTFSSMFTGRWEDACARDEEGHVFLDHDPEMIQLIVNHLRDKKIEHPSKPVPPPIISKEKKEAFKSLLQYYGLDQFFSLSPPAADIEFQSCTTSSSEISTSFTEGKCRVTYNGSGHAFLTVSPQLEGKQTFYWKCTIVQFSSNGWLYLGVIGTQNPSKNCDSFWDPTSFGWARNYHYSAGKSQAAASGWGTFVKGEVVFFRLKNGILSMYSNVKDRSFTLTGVPKNPFIHFNLHTCGTVVKLENLSETEKETVEWE